MGPVENEVCARQGCRSLVMPDVGPTRWALEMARISPPAAAMTKWYPEPGRARFKRPDHDLQRVDPLGPPGPGLRSSRAPAGRRVPFATDDHGRPGYPARLGRSAFEVSGRPAARSWPAAPPAGMVRELVPGCRVGLVIWAGSSKGGAAFGCPLSHAEQPECKETYLYAHYAYVSTGFSHVLAVANGT